MNALRVCTVLLTLGISACATTAFWGASKDDYSGVGRGQAHLYVLRIDKSAADFSLPDPELLDVAKRACRSSDAQVDLVPYLIPLAAAAGQLLFTLWTNEQLRVLANTAKAAKPAPSTVRISMGADAYREGECLAFIRMTEAKDKTKAPTVGLSVLLKTVRQPTSKSEAYVLVPVYARAFDSIAVAAKPESGELAKVDLAVAVSVKQVTRTQVGDPTIALQGETLVKAGGVGLGPKGVARCASPEPPCDASDLLVLPPKGSVISLSVSVAEIGNVGFDVDAAEAELKAINAAIGPAIGKALEARLK